jgi:uncharacterized protein
MNMGLLLILGIGLIAGIVRGVIRFLDHAPTGAGPRIRTKDGSTGHGGGRRHGEHLPQSDLVAGDRLARLRAYAATGVPAAVLGVRTMLVLPLRAVDAAMGVFLLLMIPARRWMATNLELRLPHLAAAGAVIGFLTGIVAATGPADVPFFIGYDLTKGAFIGIEAAASNPSEDREVELFRHSLPLSSTELICRP